MSVHGTHFLPNGQEVLSRVPLCPGVETPEHTEVLELLLKDHTTQQNIIWATDSYASRGRGYGYKDHITIEAISGEFSGIIIPRAYKCRTEQQQRSREMAEVFTPAWICNKQNNLIDSAWFGREGVFNNEIVGDDGRQTWRVNPEKVAFPPGRTWRDYVGENRMEITCGEAPYLVSRYDAVTGQSIPLPERVGLLDRKLRVVGENTAGSGEWLKGVQLAYKSTYGFEWQGDNLLLARLALFRTFLDSYRQRFDSEPLLRSQRYIAYIISWNIWQMDGLKGVIPMSCGERRTVVADLFGEHEVLVPCAGCRNGDIRAHNGVYALIRDWSAPKNRQKIRYVDLIK